jgi:hypothetical protein
MRRRDDADAPCAGLVCDASKRIRSDGLDGAPARTFTARDHAAFRPRAAMAVPQASGACTLSKRLGCVYKLDGWKALGASRVCRAEIRWRCFRSDV